VPARLSFAAQRKSLGANRAARRAKLQAVKTGNLRDSSSLVPFARSFECRRAIRVGKRPAQVLQIGHFASRRAQRGGNENIVGTLPGTIKAGSSPRRARAINRF